MADIDTTYLDDDADSIKAARPALLDVVQRFNQLISSIGSSLVGFIQDGTGAITQQVQSKLRRRFEVLDFIPLLTVTSTTDCSAYVQAAIDKRAADGGGIVYLGPITIKLSNITVKHGVTLLGDGMSVTTIIVTDLVNPAFKLDDYCAIRGVRFVYPDQITTGAPTPYPPSITHGSTVAASYVSLWDLDFYNSYDAIVLGDAAISVGPIFLGEIYGFPMHKGIELDNCLDVPYLNSIHFNPNTNPGMDNSTYAEIYQSAVAYNFKRVDGLAANGIFAYGYAVGMRLTAGLPSGSANMIRVLNFGFDICRSPLDVNSHQDGVFLTNGFCTTGGTHRGIAGGVCVLGGAQTSVAGKITVTNVSFRSFNTQTCLINSNTELHGCTHTDYNIGGGSYNAVQINGTNVRLLVDGGGADGSSRATTGGIGSEAMAGADVIVTNFEFRNMTSYDIRVMTGNCRVKNNTDSAGSIWNYVPFAHVGGDMATYQAPNTFPSVVVADFPVGARFVQQLPAVGSAKGWVRTTAVTFVSEGNL